MLRPTGNKNVVVKASTADQEFTVYNNGSNLTGNKILVNAKNFKRWFFGRIVREMGIIADTAEKRIQNGFLTAIDTGITLKVEVTVTSMNVSSGRDATSVTVNSERGELIGVTAFFENVSVRNNTLHVLNMKDETRNKFPGVVSDLSFPEALFDQQHHTRHMVTGLGAQTNQIFQLLTGRNLTLHNPASH